MAGLRKAMVAMSGGVDSSVAALLTQRRGYECVGVTMKLFSNEDVGADASRPCCSLADAADAARAAAVLGMPHYVFDFREDFRQDVIARFVASYEAGATPNPCIDCNNYVKFGRLFERMRRMGFERLATGHYAGVEYDDGTGRWLLKRAAYLEKDQTYFLYTMTQPQLARTCFPLSGLSKPEVRRHAAEAGLENAKKPESQDICFVRNGDYAAFIEEYAKRAYPPGDFVGLDGRPLGRHRGIVRYTVGQRKGLGVALGRPVYVSEIRPETNEVVLADEAAVFADAIEVDGLNLIAADRISGATRTEAVVRYNARPTPAEIVPMDGAVAENGGRVLVRFDAPVRAPARGQAAVFYNGDVVLGGGRVAGRIESPTVRTEG